MFVKFMSLLIVLLVISCYEITAQLRTNFVVKHLGVCHTKSQVDFNSIITTEGNEQYCDANVTLPFLVDDNFGLTALIEHSINGKTFIPLHTIYERYACKAANRYMGEYWYDIERAMQIIPGACPVRPGHYHLHHYHLDFKKLALQTFPFGTLKFTINVIENRTNQSRFCTWSEVENVMNL